MPLIRREKARPRFWQGAGGRLDASWDTPPVRIASTAAALVVAILLLLTGAPAAQATPCTTVPVWPGAAAPRQAIAAWMATGATAAGIPGELPVMGALAESGLTNVSGGNLDVAGYFGMRVSVWLGAYPGFPDHPEVQLQWFTDQALIARAARAARGIDNSDPNTWGEWVADVERPAEEYRGRYQLQLVNAQALVAAGCPPPAAPPAPPPPLAVAPADTTPPQELATAQAGAPPPAADATPPAVTLSGPARERLTRAGRVRVRLRCPYEACRASVRASLAVAGRRRVLSLPTARRLLGAGQARTVTLTVGRAARRVVTRALRRGSAVRARLRITVTDTAGNVTSRARVIRIV